MQRTRARSTGRPVAMLSWLVGSALVAGAVVLPATPVAATPIVPPTLSLADGSGNPLTTVAPGDGINVTTGAPITASGQTAQQIDNSWDPSQVAVTTSSIVRPEGWTLQYTADGTTWSNSAPVDPLTIRGLRTLGAVDSDGYASGRQVSTASGTGSVEPGAASFAGTSGGDGWDAFPAGTHVLNVWHHNNDYNLDCHDKTTGTSCGGLYRVNNYSTSRGSSGYVDSGDVYSYVADQNTGTYGVLCTVVSSLPFSSCGYTPLEGGSADLALLGTQSVSGTRLYAPIADNGGELLCFDVQSQAACGGQPYAITGFSSSLAAIPAYSIADSGDVFVTADQVWCFVGSTGSPCAGSWPVGGSFGGNVQPAVPMRNTAGTLNGACMIYPVRSCYDLTGAPVTFPAALDTLLTADPVGGGPTIGWGEYGFSATRQYWLTGGWGSAQYPVCWDWKTQAACAGFVSTASTGVLRYSLRLDEDNQNCAWTNGDNGQLASFDTFTGAAGCPGPDPVVDIPYTTIVPRMGCTENGRVLAFRDATFTVPSGVSVTALTVTVKDTAGVNVPSFVNLHPNGSGVVDLSSLSPATTGTHPSFQVTSPGTTTIDAAGISAAVRYESDPPQLCYTLVSRSVCPNLSPGVETSADLPAVSAVVSGLTTATVGGVATPTAVSASVSRAPMAGCLGAVNGTATRTYTGGSTPFSGLGVALLAPDLSTVATTTTAGNGSYSFPYVHPGTYTVSASAATLSRTVTALGTSTADFSIPAANLVVTPVTGTTVQGTAGEVAIAAATDPSTTINYASVRLWNPVTGSWGNAVSVQGEGTWDVTALGRLRFTPLAPFIGDSSAVGYQVSDGYGRTTGSTASMHVLSADPSANPVQVSAPQGSVVRLAPDVTAPTAPLAAATLRLQDPSNGQPVESLNIPEVGRFVVDTTAGQVEFTPLGDFTGSVTVTYEIEDTAGRRTSAAMTATLIPIRAVGQTLTVEHGKTGRPSVSGLPEGSTLVTPDAIPGAVLSVEGNVVSVRPSPRFSGRLRVPVTVEHGTASVPTSVTVLVRPAAVTNSWHTLRPDAATVVRWSRTAGSVGYEVRVDGVPRCASRTGTCAFGMVLGPDARVTVTAVGDDGVRAEPTAVGYRASGCVSVGEVFFGSGSALLTGATRSRLNRVAALIADQGFDRGCLVGHTDSDASQAYNLALSRRRVNGVGDYLGRRLPGIPFSRDFDGELNPVAGNGDAAGKAANRRVEIGVA